MSSRRSRPGKRRDEPSDPSPGEGEGPKPTSGFVLGVDYGKVRIGLAVGDVASGLVLPVPVLENPGSVEKTAERLAEVARGRDAVRVVIGNPLHMSGEASDMSREVAAVKDALARRLGPGVPVHLRDERLTSVDAEAQLGAAGLKWWQYPKDKVDTIAAMTIVRELLMEWYPALGRIDEMTPFEATPRDREKDARRKKRKRGRGDEDGDEET